MLTRCMSTSACPYGELVPSNVEELVLVRWDGCGVGGPTGRDGCPMLGTMRVGRGVWGQTCHLHHVPQHVPRHWGTPEGNGTPWGKPRASVSPCWGCGAGCYLHLKLSFPSFVLPAGVSPCPSAPSSVTSAKGGPAWPGGAQTCSPSSTYRYRSLAQPPATATRLSSVSSHDSGFISQDAAYSKPPSPMPSDITSQVQGGDGGVSAAHRRASVSPSVKWVQHKGPVWR